VFDTFDRYIKSLSITRSNECGSTRVAAIKELQTRSHLFSSLGIFWCSHGLERPRPLPCGPKARSNVAIGGMKKIVASAWASGSTSPCHPALDAVPFTQEKLLMNGFFESETNWNVS
jgi:hypothetical protein